jgi:hypothetical protein
VRHCLTAATPHLLSPAVMSINSMDTKTGCWRLKVDRYDVRDLVSQFLKQHK